MSSVPLVLKLALLAVVLVVCATYQPHVDSTEKPAPRQTPANLYWPTGTSPDVMCANDGGVTKVYPPLYVTGNISQTQPPPSGSQVVCGDNTSQMVS